MEKKMSNMEKLEAKYGYYLAMAVTHLMDKGWEAVSEMEDSTLEEFLEEETIRQAEAEKNGVICMMTPQFMVDLWKIAREITETCTMTDVFIWAGKVYSNQ